LLSAKWAPSVVVIWNTRPSPTPAGGSPVVEHVHFRTPDQLMIGDAVQATDYRITYPTGRLATLRRGERVTIEGVEYRVTGTPRAIKAGEETEANLSRVLA
jgi:hypothetical protein